MKYLKADLLADVVGTYDQTKTTIQGRVTSKTLNSRQVLGPPLNRFLDVQTDTGLTPVSNGIYITGNGRIFVAIAANQLALYSINFLTGATNYVGRLVFNLPNTAATTHTIRSLKIVDNGTTGWKIFLTTTGSVLINGGTFLINNVDLADFTPILGPSLPFATGNNQKAVYFLQDPTSIGVAQLQTASAGSVLDFNTNRIYVHNGNSTTHQYWVYNTLNNPTYTSNSVTVNVASPGVVTQTAHGYAVNDPVVFTAGTLPTGLVVGTVYFVRNPTANTFELSATSGGASINTTGVASVGATLGRAFGTTSNLFVFRTGNLPALTGILLLTDSEDFATPGYGPNSGQNCAFFSTNSNLYLGRLSELTAGTTSWPSLSTSNLLGTVNQITAPAATYATYSTVLDKAVYTTNLVNVIKPVVNNQIDYIFGGSNNRFLEGFPLIKMVEYQTLTATIGLDVEQGWMGVISNTTGQRGVYLTDLRSQSEFDFSYIVTKVLNTSETTFQSITALRESIEMTGSLRLFYRTSGFGSITGGWVPIDFSRDISSLASASQIQLKITFSTLSTGPSIPAQVSEILIGVISNFEISDNWEFSDEFSDNNVPSRVAFRLKKGIQFFCTRFKI